MMRMKLKEAQKKFGKNLADGATEAILAKVTEVFQDIQDQRERVQG